MLDEHNVNFNEEPKSLTTKQAKYRKARLRRAWTSLTALFLQPSLALRVRLSQWERVTSREHGTMSVLSRWERRAM
jgi:hypothetical protein